MNSATKMPLDVCAAAAGSAFAYQFEDPIAGTARRWMMWPAVALVVVSLVALAML